MPSSAQIAWHFWNVHVAQYQRHDKNLVPSLFSPQNRCADRIDRELTLNQLTLMGSCQSMLANIRDFCQCDKGKEGRKTNSSFSPRRFTDTIMLENISRLHLIQRMESFNTSVSIYLKSIVVTIIFNGSTTHTSYALIRICQ